MEIQIGSREVCRSAISLSLTLDRTDEKKLKESYKEIGIQSAAVNYGGEFTSSVAKIVEHAVVAARREGIIGESHRELGAVAGAAHEAVSQIASKAMGLNVGGKIGIARYGEHVAVAVFFEIGLLHLNEMGCGLGHRVI